MEGPVGLGIGSRYEIPFTGFGDIYEEVSVNRLMRGLRRRHGAGTVYLASNSEHGGRGMTLEEVESYVKGLHGSATEKGFVDVPPWRSKPREDGSINPLTGYPFLNMAARLVSHIVVCFERLIEGRKKAHMVYCFAKVRDAG